MGDDNEFEPGPEFEKRRKGRNLAIGLALGGFVLLIFLITLVRLGPGVLDRPM